MLNYFNKKIIKEGFRFPDGKATFYIIFIFKAILF